MSLQSYNFEPYIEHKSSISLDVHVQERSGVDITKWCMCKNVDVECTYCSEFDNIIKLLDCKECATNKISFLKIIITEEILNSTCQVDR